MVPYLRLCDVAFHGDSRLYGITPGEDLVAFDLAEDKDGRPIVTKLERVIMQPLATVRKIHGVGCSLLGILALVPGGKPRLLPVPLPEYRLAGTKWRGARYKMATYSVPASLYRVVLNNFIFKK
jgi:hypothetical protein